MSPLPPSGFLRRLENDGIKATSPRRNHVAIVGGEEPGKQAVGLADRGQVTFSGGGQGHDNVGNRLGDDLHIFRTLVRRRGGRVPCTSVGKDAGPMMGHIANERVCEERNQLGCRECRIFSKP